MNRILELSAVGIAMAATCTIAIGPAQAHVGDDVAIGAGILVVKT